jgi:predicted AlkP superfamily pyrophosphatase or phosphodiesterase
MDSTGKITGYRAISKNCDGSAYIYAKEGKCDMEELQKVIEDFNNQYKCLEAIHLKAEAVKLGADTNCSFMLEANKGYYFVDDFQGELTEDVKPEEVGKLPHRTKATHGYSPYKKDYTTVFMAKGQSINEGAVIESMSLIDEAPTMAKLLGVELPEADGKVIEEFLKFY